MAQKRINIGLVGSGWRAEFFLRIAQALPDRFHVTGCMSRKPETRAKLAKDWQIPAVETIEQLVKTKPDFVIVSVPREISPDLILELAAHDMPVLGETPPAAGIADMERLWQKLPKNARVQIAEQYPLRPLHAARLAFVASGKLGNVTEAQVSVAHGYHGTVLIRSFLGVGFEPAVIEAYDFLSSITAGRGREPGPTEEKIVPSGQVIARLQFGDKLGIYDFTGDQYFSWIRSQRLLVRGDKGEINNLDASYLADFKTPIHVRFERQDAGHHGNLEGYYHKGYLAGERWLYRNPHVPARLADDEIAVASCLEGMVHYLETGEDFYSLAEACQDNYLALLIDEAVKTRQPVSTARQSWCP
jgi:predicted dehydrogenase